MSIINCSLYLGYFFQHSNVLRYLRHKAFGEGRGPLGAGAPHNFGAIRDFNINILLNRKKKKPVLGAALPNIFLHHCNISLYNTELTSLVELYFTLSYCQLNCTRNHIVQGYKQKCILGVLNQGNHHKIDYSYEMRESLHVLHYNIIIIDIINTPFNRRSSI